MKNTNLKKTYKYLGILVAVVAGVVYGCAENRHAVIAVTGTNIGLEISENPATQMPQGKLGYQRSEISIVPSNRSGDVEPAGANAVGNGAIDVADVLMELKFSNIFSLSKETPGGIYQRLAVGETAVKQPGAAFMFARDQKGDIDPKEVLKALPEIQKIDALRLMSPLTKAYDQMDSAQKEKVDSIAQSQGYKDFEGFKMLEHKTVEQVEKIQQELKKDPTIKTKLETIDG